MPWIVLAWAVCLLSAVLYAAQSKIKPFDPNSKLAMAMHDLTFEAQLSQLFASRGIVTNNTVVHFVTSQCVCQRIASAHINSVKQLATSQDFNNMEISVANWHELGNFIPSVPAIAVFDDEAKLHYLGPYSTGLFCAPQEGLVEKFIVNTAPSQPSKSLGASIIHEANGCYCQV